MDLVTPGFGLIFWTAITFIFLLIILRKFAWKPILGAVSEREESIKNALNEADKARQEIVNLKSDNELILKEARAEREALLKDARSIKDKMISDAKDDATNQANKIVEQAKASIESEKQAALTELRNQVAELSVGIAEKVIKEELSNKDKQIALIDKMLENTTIK